MITSKDVHAIYLEDDEVRALQHDLAQLVAKAKIISIRDLVIRYRMIVHLQQALRTLARDAEEER